jgi:hypothetical protein
MVLGSGQTRSRAGYSLEFGGGRERGSERSRKRTLIRRRSGMEDQLWAHPRHDFPRRLDAHKPRADLERPRDRCSVCGG